MSLITSLPQVRGRYRENVSLDDTTWFRVGGPAEVVFKPADVEDLAHFLKHKLADISVTAIGAASNIVIRDGGIDGVVVRLGRGFNELAMEDGLLVAGAANLDVNVAQYALQQNIGGLEFLSGIPGAIGGALRMNAGAYGSEIKDVLVKAELVAAAGEVNVLSVDELGFSYRHCRLPDDVIFTKAWFSTAGAGASDIAIKMDDIAKARGDSQPIRSRTGGSTFRNPEGHKAWELIDAAGLRGKVVGGAKVSEKHCNFLINTGTATAADLEQLTNHIIEQVKNHSGVTLQPEIKFIGRFL